MPDQPDLRTQITDVLQTFPSLCALGEQYVKSVADALVSELGLTREWGVLDNDGDPISFPKSGRADAEAHIESNDFWVQRSGRSGSIHPGHVGSRYVTEWVPDA